MKYSEYKLQIYYPGIIICIENSSNLDLAKPNLRYILNDMKSKHYDYTLYMIEGGGEGNIKIEYIQDEQKFQIPYYKSEYFGSKECLDKLFAIASEWIN